MVIPFSDRVSFIDKLQGVAKEMEDDLKKWSEEVKKNRSDFYELNNYTTAQLVRLRKELGKMRANGGVAVVEPGVMLLLQSISPDLTPAEVKESVVNFVSEATSPENQRIESMLCLQDSKLPSVPSGNESLNAHHQYAPAIEPVNVSRSDVIVETINNDAINTTSVSQDKLNSDLTFEQLTEKGRDIFVNLTLNFEFHPKLVLRALKQCGEDRFAAEHWCNEQSMAFMEEEVQLDDDVTYPELQEEQQMIQTEQESGFNSKASGKCPCNVIVFP